jgi:hypothetical protein
VGQKILKTFVPEENSLRTVRLEGWTMGSLPMGCGDG